MGNTVKWTASDTAIRPEVALTRDGTPVDLTAASRIGVQFKRVVASGVTSLVASYLATVHASHNATEGIIECLTYGASPLATKGTWNTQITLTSASGVETFDSPFTVMLRERF